MNKAALILLLSMLMFFRGQSQSLVITDTTTTPSLCFNTGSITVNASGGTGPYTFSVTAGPSYPNITYPIVLPPLVTAFLTMPAGEYTIKVVDAAGHVAYATATVHGTYSFPVAIPTVSGGCIIVSVQGGRPPYQYAISSVGTNTGFSAYQTGDSFCNLCDGHYWVRIMDSCSNIYTTAQIIINVPAPQVTVTWQTIARQDHINAAVTSGGSPPFTFTLRSGALNMTNTTGIFIIPVQCPQDTVTTTDHCGSIVQTIFNMHPLSVSGTATCSLGDAELTIDSAAIPPYTITGANGVLVTHRNELSFDSLGIDTSYHFVVTDSCGNVDSITLTCVQDTSWFFTVCPWDSSIHMHRNPVPLCYPVVVTCLSCIPVQIDTIASTPARLFTGIDTGVNYTIRIQDTCGFDFTTRYIPHYQLLGVSDSVFTCSDFAVSSTPAGLMPLVHFSVFNGGGLLVDSAIGDQAVFYHLPQGTYNVTASQALCATALEVVSLPAIGGACIVPEFDSGCTKSFAIFQYITNYTETYTLVNTMTNARYIEKLPSPSSTTILFNDIPVGNYNLVSDSGCTFSYPLPPFPVYSLSVTSFVQCTGQAKIQTVCTPAINSCNTSQTAYYVLVQNNQELQSNSTGTFFVTDSGLYVIRLFYSNTSIFGFPAVFDTICPVDTALINVITTPIPNIVSTQAEVCGHVPGDIFYTITGGTPPYTVQILGYPTQTVTSTSDTFPGVYPGTYTMIVSDICGISRSFSVAVLDTCSPNCATTSHFAMSDSLTCTNAVVTLVNQSTSATHYKWVVNGSVFSWAQDTSFSAASPGIYTVTLYAYVGVCADSAKRTITVQDTLRSTAAWDTLLCAPFTIDLNTHQPNTTWAAGPADSVQKVTGPGVYLANFSNVCGSASDTITIGLYPGIAGFTLTGTKTFLCEDVPDSVTINAAIDSAQTPVVFQWSTLVVDSLAFSSQIIVYKAGTYQVTAYNGFCPVTKDLIVTMSSCDSECIAGIAVPDIFSPNGDGKNDTFYILHLCDFDASVMHIYNQWGQLVFQSTDLNYGWDGRYRGDQQPEGVYWMWCALTLPDGRTAYKTKWLTLVR